MPVHEISGITWHVFQDGGQYCQYFNSISSLEECTDEGRVYPTAEAKRLGANLATPEKAKIARERKIQTVKSALLVHKMI